MCIRVYDFEVQTYAWINRLNQGMGDIRSAVIIIIICKQESLLKKKFKNKIRKNYYRWKSMMDRCYRKRRKDYLSYGGRGITVCSYWHLFKNFDKDMGDPPSPYHSIDRIDNNKGYLKENCRWATREEQNNNRKSNVFLEHMGERLTMAQWERKLGFSKKRLKHRLRCGWSIKDALETPIGVSRKKALQTKSNILL
jgi:hypothetical protein